MTIRIGAHNLVISGSRAATDSMLRFAAHKVAEWLRAGYTLHCGDATGVDHYLMRCVTAYAPLILSEPRIALHVYGIQPQPRNWARSGFIAYHNVRHMQYHKTSFYPTYTHTSRLVEYKTYSARDDYMVRYLAHEVACIWNGQSKRDGRKAGTEIVWGLANHLRVEATMYRFWPYPQEQKYVQRGKERVLQTTSLMGLVS